MKDAITINLEIEVLKGELKTKKEEYKKLNKLNMLTEVGMGFEEKIHKLEGKITALKWVLNGVC